LPRRKKRKKLPRKLRSREMMMKKRSQSRKKPIHWMSYHLLHSTSTHSKLSLLTTKTEEVKA